MNVLHLEMEHRGPHPCCVCEADPTWALVMVVPTPPNQVAVMSYWFCDAHQHKGWAVTLAGEVVGEMCAMYPVDEAPAEIESIEEMVRGVVDEVSQRPASSFNRAERRASSSRHHRQRRRG